ncbi:glucose-6-phosphate isomerase [Spirillospora albida]|uniref:glucose-6-phosphate isomerase n=1 Tax=Spirillospora albida TaxID=58123 RepID=UPI0004BEB5A5|nr:glucose-6-phosphate isomerase [Spirillospora albida]
MTSVVTAGGISVTVRGPAVGEGEAVLDRLVSDGVPGALASGKANLWGPDAAPLAARRLGWLGLPELARSLPARIAGIAAALRDAGATRTVLIGTGGPALAAEAIARTAGADLTVLDTTDPHEAARAFADAARTAVVVTDATAESDALRRVAEAAFRAAGVEGDDLARRFVVVADAGSPHGRAARDAGHPTVQADLDVDGRFGALAARALVPAALAGVDVGALAENAARLSPALRQPYDNPALAFGAALGAAVLAGRDKLVIADQGSGLAGFAGWAEQLLAGALGRDGRGVLPVVVEGTGAPGFEPTDEMRRVVLGCRPDEAGPAREAGINVAGPLGAQFLLWQFAAAVAARVIGVDPFAEPDDPPRDSGVDLDGHAALVSGPVEIHASEELLGGAETLTEALEAVLEAVPEHGYLAVLADLDRHGDAEAAGLRPLLAARGAKVRRRPAPVTFGWATRVRHGTARYHRSGPPNGVFLQITGAVTADLPVPGRPYTLGGLQRSLAAADVRALDGPVCRLHLTDRAAGLAHLRAALT